MKSLSHKLTTSPLKVFFYLCFKCISFPGFPVRDGDLVQQTLAAHEIFAFVFVKLLTLPLCLLSVSPEAN